MRTNLYYPYFLPGFLVFDNFEKYYSSLSHDDIKRRVYQKLCLNDEETDGHTPLRRTNPALERVIDGMERLLEELAKEEKQEKDS
jgi:hypothetical protein